MRIGPVIILASALAAPAAAEVYRTPSGLVRCDDHGVGISSVFVSERSGVRTFYEGQVTLLALDTVEPACCSSGLAIVMPDEPHGDEPRGPTCWAMIGYNGVGVDRAQARYDPREGLTLTIPTSDYDDEANRSVPGAPIRLRINAARGTIVDLDAR